MPILQCLYLCIVGFENFQETICVYCQCAPFLLMREICVTAALFPEDRCADAMRKTDAIHAIASKDLSGIVRES